MFKLPLPAIIIACLSPQYNTKITETTVHPAGETHALGITDRSTDTPVNDVTKEIQMIVECHKKEAVNRLGELRQKTEAEQM